MTNGVAGQRREPTPIEQHFIRVRSSLLARGEEAGLFQHRTARGTARELVISEFLSASLPSNIGCFSGEVVAPEAGPREDDRFRSGQIDVLLIPDFAPRFQIGRGLATALAHGVVSCVEVKSRLTTGSASEKSELRTCLEAARRVKALTPEFSTVDAPTPWSYRSDNGSIVSLSTIPYGVITFAGPKIGTLADKLVEWQAECEEECLPDFFCVLEQNYTLIRNNGWLQHPGDTGLAPYFNFARNGACTFSMYYYLVKCVQTWTELAPKTDFKDYVFPRRS